MISREQADALGIDMDDEPAPDSSLDELAEKLVSKALEDDTPTETCVDIFKAVSSYELGKRKLKPAKIEEAPKMGGFQAMKNRINGGVQ